MNAAISLSYIAKIKNYMIFIQLYNIIPLKICQLNKNPIKLNNYLKKTINIF